MANNDQQQNSGPGDKQPVGLNEDSREGQATDGQTEQAPNEAGIENVEHNQASSEGEPGRAQSDSTGGQQAKGQGSGS